MPARETLRSGDRIGGYVLARRLGKGGMAEVWVARRAHVRKHVAIKVIAPHLAGQERYSRMFKAEAELAAVLTHSNIVQVFDEGEDGGLSYLVMEWVDGLNLVGIREGRGILRDGPLTPSIAAYVTGQLLHALSYAHAVTSRDGRPLGIVHRDVSPQNVLVSITGDVKLTDFGIARTVREDSSGTYVKGKLRYMAPEQLAGHGKRPALDLYAVGALLHEMLDGEKFRGEFEDERVLQAQVLGGVIPTPRRPIPPALDRLRLALLEPDEGRRVPSATEALRLLGEFSGYRDLRVELGRVCSALTGILGPRTGPVFEGDPDPLPSEPVQRTLVVPALPRGDAPVVYAEPRERTVRLDDVGLELERVPAPRPHVSTSHVNPPDLRDEPTSTYPSFGPVPVRREASWRRPKAPAVVLTCAGLMLAAFAVTYAVFGRTDANAGEARPGERPGDDQEPHVESSRTPIR